MLTRQLPSLVWPAFDFSTCTTVNVFRLNSGSLLLLLGLYISRSERNLRMDSGLWFHLLLPNIHPRFPGRYLSVHVLQIADS